MITQKIKLSNHLFALFFCGTTNNLQPILVFRRRF